MSWQSNSVLCVLAIQQSSDCVSWQSNSVLSCQSNSILCVLAIQQCSVCLNWQSNSVLCVLTIQQCSVCLGNRTVLCLVNPTVFSVSWQSNSVLCVLAIQQQSVSSLRSSALCLLVIQKWSSCLGFCLSCFNSVRCMLVMQTFLCFLVVHFVAFLKREARGGMVVCLIGDSDVSKNKQ